jgi:mRNA interferase MazF
VRSQVPIKAGDGGLAVDSFAKCEAVRSISVERLIRRRGTVSGTVMDRVSDCLRILMDL